MHVDHHIERFLCSGLLLMTLLIPVLAGCDSKQPSEQGKQETSKAVTNAKEEVTEAAGAVKDAAVDLVEGFRKGIDVKLTELDKQEEALKQKAAQAKSDVKADIQVTIANLEKEKQALRQRLAKLKTASADRAGDWRTEIDNALLKLEQEYKKARDRFSA